MGSAETDPRARLEPPLDLSDSRLVEWALTCRELGGLAPPLYVLRVRRADLPGAGGEAQEIGLRRLYEANRMLCELRHDELRRRLESFSAAGIDAIPLKGTALRTRRALPLARELRLLGLVELLDAGWRARVRHLGRAAGEVGRRLSPGKSSG